MVRKLKELAGEQVETGLAKTVRESAQQIWLAGLGAFSKAQEEGGKVFEALVREGQAIESRTRDLAQAKISEVTQQFGKAGAQAGARATQTWDKLETVFEDRVSRALGRIGVPTNKDIEALAARVEELTTSVQALAAASGKVAKTTRPTRAPRAAAKAPRRRTGQKAA